jgi:hypothetical protein
MITKAAQKLDSLLFLVNESVSNRAVQEKAMIT